MVSVTYNREAKALYLKLGKVERVVKTIPIGKGGFVDVAESGKAVGLEIIFPESMTEEAIDALKRLKPIQSNKVPAK